VQAPIDVTGKWEGKITGQRDDGTMSEDSALLILTQKDGTITGTVGSDESDRHPITSGTINETKISLLATHERNKREFKIELTVEGDEMKGTLVSGDRRGQLVLKRRKE
jgi:hypothetical protein